MKNKKLIFIIAAVVGIAITLLLITKNMATYGIITGALSVVFLVLVEVIRALKIVMIAI